IESSGLISADHPPFGLSPNSGAASIRVIRTGGWVRPARTALLSAISTYPFSHPVSHLRAAGRWPFDAAARQGRDRVGLEADVLLGARAIAVASLSVYNHN